MGKKKSSDYLIEIDRPVTGYADYLNFDSYAIGIEKRSAIVTFACTSGVSIAHTVLIDLFDLRRVVDSFREYLTRMEHIESEDQLDFPKRFAVEKSTFANHMAMAYNGEIAEIAFWNFSVCDLTVEKELGDKKSVKPDGALLARCPVSLHKSFLVDLLSIKELSQ